MVDARRVAAVVLRHSGRLGAPRIRRRLARAGLTARQIDAGFRFARFLATRGAPARRKPPRRPHLAAAALAAWSAVVFAAATVRLRAEAPETPPDDASVDRTVEAYAPPPLAAPVHLDALLPRRSGGDAGPLYALVAARAFERGPRLFFRGGDLGLEDSVGLLRQAAARPSCRLLGLDWDPRDDDGAARLPLLVAGLERLAADLGARGTRWMGEGRWDLAERSALEQLSLGRHWLEDWLPDEQAAGARRVLAGLDALRRCLAARGRYDARAQLALAEAAIEASRYAAQPRELRRIVETARDPARLSELDRYLQAGPLRRPYGYAALESAAVAWSPSEAARGDADARRAAWLGRAAASADPRLAALARGALRRLTADEARCRLRSGEPGACPSERLLSFQGLLEKEAPADEDAGRRWWQASRSSPSPITRS